MITDKEMLAAIEDPHNLLGQVFMEKSTDASVKRGMRKEISKRIGKNNLNVTLKKNHD